METIIFDGKKFAQEKLEKLKEKVSKLGLKGKLVSIIAGEGERNLVYAKLKQEAAKKIGLTIEIKDLGEGLSYEEVKKEIEKLNKDADVAGIMLQLPLADNLKDKTSTLIHLIKPEKDLDGMRDDSCYLAPVVRGVMEIIKISGLKNSSNPKIVVLGAKGFVGKKIVRELMRNKFSPYGLDLENKDLGKETVKADLLVTTCSCPGIITGEMIKKGAVIIDVSSPKGDVKTEEIIGKAGFVSPVPGGVGPMTISYLLENLVEKLEGNLVQ
jgi:methylenetetrahydrofolate dehydrogenase (NADP+)/methenyltetrahydrofolate cyclohydrolase